MADCITGPEATIVASLFAALFAAAQVCVARALKNIAYDKLKLDLFEKRYAIYSAAKKLIEAVRGGRGSRIEDVNFFLEHYITLDEARFFFDCEIQSFLRNIIKEGEAYLEAVDQNDNSGASEHKKKLNAIYDEIPTWFQNTLEFKALKSPKRLLLSRCIANLARKCGK
jgi:hypothetical protein